MKKKRHQNEHDDDFTHIHVAEDGVHREEADEQAEEKNERDIEKGLKAIYGETTDDLHVVQSDKSWLTRFLIKTVIALSAAVLFVGGAFFAYSALFQGRGGSEPLSMNIEAPASVQSGGAVTLVINYANPRDLPLAQLAIDVNVPTGFVMTSTQPVPTKTEELVWDIGSLGRNSDGKIELVGYWFSEVPSVGNIQAVATYRPANFNSDFSYISTATIAVDDALLDAKMEGPASVVPGQESEYTLTLSNTADRALENISTSFTLPATFIASAFDPSLEPGGALVWNLPVVAPGASAVCAARHRRQRRR